MLLACSFSDVLSQTAVAGLPKPSVCAPNNAPCKAAPHFQVPRSKAAFSPLARYFNNGSFPFQHSEHKRNESKFGSLTQACSRETPLVQMSTLSSVFGSKPGRWELRAHISSADDLLWFVQLCTKKVCGDVYQSFILVWPNIERGLLFVLNIYTQVAFSSSGFKKPLPS